MTTLHTRICYNSTAIDRRFSLFKSNKSDFKKCKLFHNIRRKNKANIVLKTGRFDIIDSAVIISSVSKAVQITLLMTTAECMSVETFSFQNYCGFICFPSAIFVRHLSYFMPAGNRHHWRKVTVLYGDQKSIKLFA